jgi:hypothetical protein
MNGGECSKLPTKGRHGVRTATGMVVGFDFDGHACMGVTMQVGKQITHRQQERCHVSTVTNKKAKDILMRVGFEPTPFRTSDCGYTRW